MNNLSPLSLGGTPLRKQGKKGPWKAHKSGAKFPDKDYVAYHGTYGEFGTSFSDPNASLCRDKDYRRRQPLPLDQRRSGPVTDADASVIRQRNLPLLFHKQFAEVGRWTHPELNKAYLHLFPDGSRYHSQEPEYRPNPGCIQTRFWTDSQVRTWAHLAKLYAITYSGQTEYNFPRSLLGKHAGGTYYSRRIPWPKPGEQGPALSFKWAKPARRKRSELSRILRALRRRSKEFVSKPLSIGEVLTVRKVLSHKEIGRRYDHSCPISQFRESIPNCLSIRFGKPAQVPQIVLESLRRIYSTPQKFLHDLSWLAPSGADLCIKLQMKVAPRKAQQEKVRRIVTLHSDQGGVFRASVGTGHQLYLVDTNFHGIIKSPEEKKEVVNNFHLWQNFLDDQEDDYSREGVLGSWFSKPA